MIGRRYGGLRMSGPESPTPSIPCSAMLRDNLRDWDRTLVWHAFTQMAEYEPLAIERAEGCTLIDIDGNRYLDGVSSLWCNIHGHRHPKIDAAIRAARPGCPRDEPGQLESDNNPARAAAGGHCAAGIGTRFLLGQRRHGG